MQGEYHVELGHRVLIRNQYWRAVEEEKKMDSKSGEGRGQVARPARSECKDRNFSQELPGSCQTKEAEQTLAGGLGKETR